MIRFLASIALCCLVVEASEGYPDVARQGMTGFALFGEAIPTTPSGDYAHDTDTWPGTVYDFSGYSAYQVTSGDVNTNDRSGTLITPRHALSSYHIRAQIPVGMDLVFYTREGVKVTRTITDHSDLIGNDVLVLTLDSAVTDCEVYPLATAESLDTLVGATILCLRPDRSIVTRRVSSIANGLINHVADSTGGVISSSGHPAFTTVRDRLVVLGDHHYATAFPNAAAATWRRFKPTATTGQTISTISVDPTTWAETLEPDDAL